jgi:hypothetical protein
MMDGPILGASYLNPTSICIDDPTQQIYLSDTGNNLIRQIDLTTNTVSVLAGDGQGVADGIVYISQHDSQMQFLHVPLGTNS